MFVCMHMFLCMCICVCGCEKMEYLSMNVRKHYGDGGGGRWVVMCVHLYPLEKWGGCSQKMYKKKKICSYCVNVSFPFLNSSQAI